VNASGLVGSIKASIFQKIPGQSLNQDVRPVYLGLKWSILQIFKYVATFSTKNNNMSQFDQFLQHPLLTFFSYAHK
jgi:hypothetical protein